MGFAAKLSHIDTGKGANTVVSPLHQFLENHTLRLHADNCSGLNKNNAVYTCIPCITYILSLVPGMESGDWAASINNHILPACWPHKVFNGLLLWGMFKQKFRCCFVSRLREIADVVTSSAQANTAQVVVTMHHWAGFLGEHFRKIPRVKSYHDFEFIEAMPGRVQLRLYSDSATSEFKLLTDNS